MGCSSEIKENENNKNSELISTEKEKQVKNIKKFSLKDLNNINKLETSNNKDNILKISRNESSIFNKEKEKTISSSMKQIDIKSKINKEENKENNSENELEIPMEKGAEIFNPVSSKKLNNFETINLKDNENNQNGYKINYGPIPINIKDRLTKRNLIKYAILEKENESEDNSNIKNNNKNVNNIKQNIEQYKEPKYNYYVSRNGNTNENLNTNISTIPSKYIRRYTTCTNKCNTEIFEGLLLKEENNLSLSFENLVPLQTEKPSKKYKILTILGNGAFGKVYKAMNVKTENIVAIKSIKKKKDNKL